MGFKHEAMIKIKIIDDTCLVIPMLHCGKCPDDEQVVWFPLEEAPDRIPVLKLFDLDTLKRFDTLTLHDDQVDISDLDNEDENAFTPNWHMNRMPFEK